jgi:hypothetical protein
MPWMGFEPTIPESERAKTFHAVDRAATVIGLWFFHNYNNQNYVHYGIINKISQAWKFKIAYIIMKLTAPKEVIIRTEVGP